MSLNDVWKMYLFQILGSCLDDEDAGCEKDNTVFCGIEEDIAEKCFTDILANAKDYIYYVVTELMEDTNHLIWEYIESWDYGEKLNIYADKKYEALYHMTFDGLYDAIVAGNLPAPEYDTTYADKAPEISREKFIDLMFIAKKTKQDEEEELAELKHDLDPDVYTEVDERLDLSYGSHSLIDAIHSLMNVDNNELSLIRTYIEDLK